MKNFIYNQYEPSWWFRSGHLQSIYSSICAPRYFPNYHRQRIETSDGDFLDLDWSFASNNRDNHPSLVILSHGLEGNTSRNYITGMAGHLNNAGLDVLAWNYRGCSGEVNRKRRLYHNGSIDDLERVVDHALRTGYENVAGNDVSHSKYKNIFLVGFSMGGNLTLLYLGKEAGNIPNEVKGAVAFSVPSDLAGSAIEIGKPHNIIYMKRFLRHLKRKVIAKANQFPSDISSDNYNKIKNFKDFDDRYTAPIHGFASAEDYWHECGSGRWLDKISTPSLMINSIDDPFLSANCYPQIKSDYLKTVYPKHGGHVGFIKSGKSYWSEQVCLEFINYRLRNLT